MICKVFKLTKLEIENAGDKSVYMSIWNTHTHYAVGYDNADVALVCLFVTYRHHPTFSPISSNFFMMTRMMTMMIMDGACPLGTLIWNPVVVVGVQ